MEKIFRAKVNGEFEFEFNQNDIDNLDSLTSDSNKVHIIYDDKSLNLKLEDEDFYNQNYQVKVNSNAYHVQISNDLDVLINEMGLTLAAGSLVNDIKAPMPGLILDINVQEGQEVREGETLLILEAMKMENALTAPRDAVIKSIPASKGNTVAKNELLIEME